MMYVLWAFSLFHLFAGAASLGLAVRLLTGEERAHWRSRRALTVAEAICWVYPALALGATLMAWRAYGAGGHEALPLVIAPMGWLILMGIVFAIVDFTEDGIIGNARSRDQRDTG